MYLDTYTDEINALCIRYKVRSLCVFGSVLTDQFSEKSDIDLIVDIDVEDPYDYAERYFDLKFALEDLLKKPVDLLENRAIKNPYFLKNLENSKSLLYISGQT
jgi:predicted nucleotidyltransferase